MKGFSRLVAGALVAAATLTAIPSLAQQAPPPKATVCDETWVPQCVVNPDGSYHCVHVLVSNNCREVEITINPDP